jgi:DNA-binding beta-propeller fold protein YncE
MSVASGLTINSAGNVILADAGNDRVEVCDGNGTYSLEFGLTGTGNGQFNFPYDVDTDANGNIYVVDGLNSRVQVFGPGSTPAMATSWGKIKADYR